jgi:heme exporter protein B
LVFLLSTQIELPARLHADVIGGLVWLAIFFSGTLVLERSASNDHEGGYWEVLLLYPIGASELFLSRTVVNFLSILVLEAVLIPLFTALTDVPLLARPGPMILIAVVSGIGFAAIGTLVGALTAGVPSRGTLLAVLLLPLLTPVLIGAAEATRILVDTGGDPMWWWWVQVLAVFATTFTVVGALAFEFLLEE